MKFYDIDEINSTGLARAIYTTADHPDWKFGKDYASENFLELSSQLGITPDDVTMTNQTHTSIIRVVDRENGGELVTRPLGGSGGSACTVCSACTPEVADLQDGFDGLLTSEPGLMLCTVEADCVPVYILDPVKKAIGMVHSGWRGTVAKITAKAISRMTDEYGTDPADLIIHIGPCICENCYEVGEELIDVFAEAFGHDAAAGFFTPRVGCEGTAPGTGKYNLDMKKAIRYTLAESGVAPENISDENRCTFETEELCSWRRQQPVRTSMLTAIMLNSR